MKLRKRKIEYDEEDEDEYLESDIEVEPAPPLQEDCSALLALSTFALALSNGRERQQVIEKCRRIAERIEPTEVGQDINVDEPVIVTERIRKITGIDGTIERQALYDIGRRAKELHIEYYKTPPRKVPKEIEGNTKYINVYTEQTAPKTLDVAIKEFYS